MNTTFKRRVENLEQHQQEQSDAPIITITLHRKGGPCVIAMGGTPEENEEALARRQQESPELKILPQGAGKQDVSEPQERS